MRSGSPSSSEDENLRQGQVWQTVSHRRVWKGFGSPQRGSRSLTGSGTSRFSGSSPAPQPAQDVFFSCSKLVRILLRGRARQVALTVHLYFRNKEPVLLPWLQQVMATGSIVWLNWNIGWEDKNRVRGTCQFQPAQHEQGKFIGAVAWV